MQVTISVRHGELSDATQERLIEKAGKLLRYFERLTAIHVTVDLEHTESPKVELKVSAEHKHDFVARDQASELWAAADSVVHKMEQQLKKYKQRIQDHRGPGNRASAPQAEPGAELE